VVGFQSVDPAVKDAAKGMGMTHWESLKLVEIPQALPFILTGLRHAFILNIGTASIGALIGAGGLGTIIISGLTLRNSALVFSGTIVVVFLAILGDKILSYKGYRRK
jgi:osmoprotectant transport system permease protein